MRKHKHWSHSALVPVAGLTHLWTWNSCAIHRAQTPWLWTPSSVPTVLKMVDDRWAMYDRFSGKGAHSTNWFEWWWYFLKLAFAGDHLEVKCPCNRYQKRRMLSENEMSGHIAKHRFMSNYLLCTSMDRYRHPHRQGRTKAMMSTEWMTW
jgi:hypothetical protein